MRRPLSDFLASALPHSDNLRLLADDASFRKYFRVEQAGISYVLMDAPPDKEDAGRFVQVATAFAQAGLNVPEIIEEDSENGYLLLSDFGDETLQFSVTAEPQRWLPKCLEQLLQLQRQGGQHLLELPEYDNLLVLKELGLFAEWFVAELLNEHLSRGEEALINDLNQLLLDNMNNQRRVWVHRDYHCRNLMKLADDKLGLIDFQDAVFGPITYDLVSLLKDCYARYPKALVEEQLQYHYVRLVNDEMYDQAFDTFKRAFDLTGLQRHLKVLGIFARLSLRDKKHAYLNDLPLVFDYIFEVLNHYSELHRYLPLFTRLAKDFEQKILS